MKPYLKLLTILLFAPCLVAISSLGNNSHGLIVLDLRCERIKDPIAVDDPRPFLSWRATSDRNGETLTGCEVQVATDVEKLEQARPDLWDSGRLTTGDMLGIRYGGRTLRPGELAYWRVRVCGRDGTASPWSRTANWAAGLSDGKDWSAEWIGATDRRTAPGTTDAPVWLFRKDFDVQQIQGRFTLYLAAVGIAEAWINGRKVGDAVLEPAVTDLRKRVLYRAYDVAPYIRLGRNTLGIRLGNGFLDHPGASLRDAECAVCEFATISDRLVRRECGRTEESSRPRHRLEDVAQRNYLQLCLGW